ncbi:hypothetical protein HII36_06300 [Nonomuraea sp. NN258]|uniref:hypothetical protein n=1 Tax=Nonomuraea antri TaxID=2730852 RepID=UPI00156A4B19|nr:hypothetical protein [Nonomuraea antri]NRQ31452.1 hypothetical protein [Nonomuraea antri]
MLRFARAALYTVIPAELLIVIMIVSGVSLPAPLVVAVEVAVVLVFGLEMVTGCRLFLAARRRGAGRRAAAEEAVRTLVPEPVLKVVMFEVKGMVSIVRWVLRRRAGVPEGATAVSYAKEQWPLMLVMLFAMVVETVGLDLLLVAIDAPAWLRFGVLVLDVYSVLFAVALAAACEVHPHVITADELRIRYGAYFDLRIPRDQIASVRVSRSYNESSMVRGADGRLSVAVSSQTNLVVELTEPVAYVRPLGKSGTATTVRFFADTPAAALAALRPADARTVNT